ncbi:phospholipase D-like domain-containing protein [Hymenobacter sp. M29]|uniref:phospholipase D n=1 Tax=Hymenobacter mellowenesis TaxID=3063995 RepID=A0ABT9AAQ5_9BACT|nr:phospholipase D-like domain-containing protein [Hymenobacter sp. M29]MDO7846275.1 phospholipase D-like domain-containing protein [Hymenobacter sp. M29]
MTSSAYFSGLSTLVQEELLKAKTSIEVAVAWFTDQSIFRVLVQQASNKVQVRVIIRRDAINFNALDEKRIPWQDLIAAGGQLLCSPDYPALHHKFCVVDGRSVLTGSYNWTYAARRNHENVVVCSEAEVVQGFGKAYETLFGASNLVKSIPALLPEDTSTGGEGQAKEAALELALRDGTKDNTTGESTYYQLVWESDAAYAAKKYKDAEAAAKKAILLKPHRVEGYYVLAGVYWRTNKLTECLALAEVAETEAPDASPKQRADLWNTIGLALDGLGRYKDAVRYFDRSINNEPENSIWYKNKYLTMLEWRPSEAKRVATEGRQRASAEIQKYKDGNDKSRLLRAYLVQSGLREHEQAAARRQDAREAQVVYERIPAEERDLHDLDEIKRLLRP